MQAARWLGVICYFLVFLVMGMWHGSTSIFLLYGIVLGASVALNKLWQELMIVRLGHKGYRALAKKRLYGTIGQGLTASYFAVALTAFWIKAKDLDVLATHLGVVGVVLVILGLSAAWSVLGFVSAPVWQRFNASRGRSATRSRSALAGYLGLAALVLSCVAVQAILNKPPEFVYAKF